MVAAASVGARGDGGLIPVPLDADHAGPLATGGADTDGNVQVLCRGCHQLKTNTEFGARVS
ncbi:HNH endonuclease [Streptomyces sp. P1-3]|uniref:HNH endonuclease n=1 Tax=Streptomyces sp. P1-3 TaxID=3421658 RepID=UPI003D364436